MAAQNTRERSNNCQLGDQIVSGPQHLSLFKGKIYNKKGAYNKNLPLTSTEI
jgi:hypothetical protein